MRISASRPRNADASRLVTSACSGASGSPCGGGMCSSSTSNSGSRLSPSGFSPLAGSVVLAMPARPDAYSVGNPSASSAAFWASSSRSEATSSSRSWLSETTSAIRASGRSVLLTTRITGRCAASALRSTKRVCGSGPSDASTSSSTPSTIDRPRSTSPPKSAWPGVSITLITVIAAVGVVAVHGGVLGEDRDALFPLQVTGVHDALGGVVTSMCQRARTAAASRRPGSSCHGRRGPRWRRCENQGANPRP